MNLIFLWEIAKPQHFGHNFILSTQRYDNFKKNENRLNRPFSYKYGFFFLKMVIFVLVSVLGYFGVIRTAMINTSTWKIILKVSAIFLETSRARRNAFTFSNLGEKTISHHSAKIAFRQNGQTLFETKEYDPLTQQEY